ncbi:hypothetical protein GQR58_022786 [Nymphon striatum]|nr:hypothetical protein GQR58_022786 [Nymphon striatum]
MKANAENLTKMCPVLMEIVEVAKFTYRKSVSQTGNTREMYSLIQRQWHQLVPEGSATNFPIAMQFVTDVMPLRWLTELPISREKVDDYTKKRNQIFLRAQLNQMFQKIVRKSNKNYLLQHMRLLFVAGSPVNDVTLKIGPLTTRAPSDVEKSSRNLITHTADESKSQNEIKVLASSRRHNVFTSFLSIMVEDKKWENQGEGGVDHISKFDSNWAVNIWSLASDWENFATKEEDSPKQVEIEIEIEVSDGRRLRLVKIHGCCDKSKALFFRVQWRSTTIHLSLSYINRMYRSIIRCKANFLRMKPFLSFLDQKSVRGVLENNAIPESQSHWVREIGGCVPFHVHLIMGRPDGAVFKVFDTCLLTLEL